MRGCGRVCYAGGGCECVFDAWCVYVCCMRVNCLWGFVYSCMLFYCCWCVVCLLCVTLFVVCCRLFRGFAWVLVVLVWFVVLLVDFCGMVRCLA